MPKNYYIILGIPESSSPADIKAAYRRLAKEFHPDLAVANQTMFPVIHEAYTVLSDPTSRRNYDRSLQGNIEVQVYRRRQSTQSLAGEQAEPLVPSPAQNDNTITSLDRSIHQYMSVFDGLFDRMLTNFSEQRLPQTLRFRNMTVEVLLTPEQADRGGNVRLNVPVEIRCPSCASFTGRPYGNCWRCNGSGYLIGEQSMLINYPSGISRNHRVQLSLSLYGGRHRHLTVVFVVQESR